jgi:hypothetical protein
VKNIEFAIPAAARLAGHGLAPLSIATPDAGGHGLPVVPVVPMVAVAPCSGAASRGAAPLTGPRLASRQAAEFTRVRAVAAVTKSMKTNTRKHVQMTRVNANGYGATGPHPAREPA